MDNGITNGANVQEKNLVVRANGWCSVENVLIRDEGLTGRDLLVYMALAYHADCNTNECFPSINRLSKIARTSRRATVESIKKLMDSGYVKKEKRTNGNGSAMSNLYTLTGRCIRKRKGG